jgi:hypothetical protein
MEKSKGRLEELKQESKLMDAEQSNISERNLLIRFNIQGMTMSGIGTKGNDRFKLDHRIHEMKRLVSAQPWKPLFGGRTRTPGGGEQLHLHLTGKKTAAFAAGGSASSSSGRATAPKFPNAMVCNGAKWLSELDQSEAVKHSLYLALAECMGERAMVFMLVWTV